MYTKLEDQQRTFCTERSTDHLDIGTKRKNFRRDIASNSRRAIIKERREQQQWYKVSSSQLPNSSGLLAEPVSTVSVIAGFCSRNQDRFYPQQIGQPPFLQSIVNSNHFGSQGEQHPIVSPKAQSLNLDNVQPQDQTDPADHFVESMIPEIYEEFKDNQFSNKQQKTNFNQSSPQFHQWSPSQFAPGVSPPFQNKFYENQFPDLQIYSRIPSFYNSPISSPNNNGLNYSFQAKLNNPYGISPPQTGGKFTFCQFSPSSPFVNQNGRNSPIQQDFLVQTLLSNGRITQDPFNVNPHFQAVEENMYESSTEILKQTRVRLEEQYLKMIDQEQMHENEQDISPFNKKKAPEPYSAEKHEKIKDSSERKYSRKIPDMKKYEKQVPLTSVKKQYKRMPQKVNPQIPKADQPVKKYLPSLPSEKEESAKYKFQRVQRREELFKEKQLSKKAQKSKSKEKQKEEPMSSIRNRYNPDDLLLTKHKVTMEYKNYFVLDKKLGEGTFAAVYLGYNSLLRQKVAVKIMKIKKEKQMSEVKYLKELNHKNVITLYDYFMEEEIQTCYLFMEFCEENLRERLDRFLTNKLSRKEELEIRVSYVEQLIEGMDELNTNGYIHRDLKFENILVKDEVLKIGDFGLCRKVNKKLEIESVRCGTPYTMAPEIYFHSKHSHFNPVYTQKSDIFSLAVIFHELLYNIHPFDCEQNNLKTLTRVDVSKNQAILKEVSAEANIEISWIKDIINKGLKMVDERINWEEIMTIYRTKHLRKIKTKFPELTKEKKAEPKQKEQTFNDVSNLSFKKRPSKNQHQKVEIMSKDNEKEGSRAKSNKKRESFEMNMKKQAVIESTKEKQNNSEDKLPEVEVKSSSKKCVSGSSGRKPQFDIQEEARKLFGERKRQEANSDSFLRKPRIISFDKPQSENFGQNSWRKDRYEGSDTARSNEEKVEVIQDKRKSIVFENGEKSGANTLTMMAIVVITLSCLVVFKRLFMYFQ